GQELRDAGEGDQPDGGEGVRAARQVEIAEAEEQDQHDRKAAGVEDEAAHALAVAYAGACGQAQHDGHDDVVGDHDRQRDGFEDDHRGGRGKAADEGEQRQPVLAVEQGQGEREHVGIRPVGHEGQPEQRDGEREQAHAQHVGGKDPARGAQVFFVGVLDHRDLELARQADDGGGGQHRHGDPAVAKSVVGVDFEARCGGAGEDRLHAAADIDDEKADGEEGGELDDGFEGDGSDDAVVLLLGVDVAGAEQDGEQRHAGGDAEGEADLVPAFEAAAPEFGGPGDGFDRGGDGLELQGDIGGDGDHGEDGDQHGQRARFAEARGQEVGDRGDALVVADAHEAAQDEPPAHEDDGGAEIDGEIFQPVAGGGADRAVKRPARAIDRDRERVDEG